MKEIISLIWLYGLLLPFIISCFWQGVMVGYKNESGRYERLRNGFSVVWVIGWMYYVLFFGFVGILNLESKGVSPLDSGFWLVSGFVLCMLFPICCGYVYGKHEYKQEKKSTLAQTIT